MEVVQSEEKRVVALYRVSSKQQVDKNGIPLQEMECRVFAKSMNWKITKEYYEKGVSGFKKKASERKNIQQIKQEVLEGKYDILLLFMCDRLGRLEDDTFELAKWFLAQEIEIWTVRDGQIRNDNIGDKIMNLIRFASAQEESEKTSFRISNRMRQLTEQGFYTGGPVPFGYKKVRKGRLDKKGREVYDLEIKETEVETVRMIFHLYVFQGMGTEKIANYLNEHGIQTNGGRPFRCNSVNWIIGNYLLIGYYKHNDALSIHLPAIQIIDEDLFKKAQLIKAERSTKRSNDRRNAMHSKKMVLLSGNLFCGHCGCRMGSFTKHGRKKQTNGEMKDYGYRDYYHCLKKRQYKICDGQTIYLANKVDKEIEQFLNTIFSRANYKKRKSIIDKKTEEYLESLTVRRDDLEKEVCRTEKERRQLHMEMAPSLDGKSMFTPAELKQAMTEQQVYLAECVEEISDLDTQLSNAQKVHQNLQIKYDEFCSWAKNFKKMDPNEKRYVVNQLLYKVILKRGFDLKIELNVEYKQFFEDIEYIQKTNDTRKKK